MASEAAQLIAGLKSRGMTQADIARQLGRSSRLIRYVEREIKPGANLVGSLRQLEHTGTTSQAPRRRAASGQLVPVRAPRSASVPSLPPPTPVPPPRAGRFGARRAATHGGGMITITWPRSRQGPGWERAQLELHAWARQHPHATVVVTAGNTHGLWRSSPRMTITDAVIVAEGMMRGTDDLTGTYGSPEPPTAISIRTV